MKFVIETNLATRPARWLLDDDNRVVAWAGRTYPSLTRAAVRRVQQQACTAIGP